MGVVVSGIEFSWGEDKNARFSMWVNIRVWVECGIDIKMFPKMASKAADKNV
jgi:hypothetical protein